VCVCKFVETFQKNTIIFQVTTSRNIRGSVLSILLAFLAAVKTTTNSGCGYIIGNSTRSWSEINFCHISKLLKVKMI
jgi:hypothetical protein